MKKLRARFARHQENAERGSMIAVVAAVIVVSAVTITLVGYSIYNAGQSQSQMIDAHEREALVAAEAQAEINLMKAGPDVAIADGIGTIAQSPADSDVTVTLAKGSSVDGLLGSFTLKATYEGSEIQDFKRDQFQYAVPPKFKPGAVIVRFDSDGNAVWSQ